MGLFFLPSSSFFNFSPITKFATRALSDVRYLLLQVVVGPLRAVQLKAHFHQKRDDTSQLQLVVGGAADGDQNRLVRQFEARGQQGLQIGLVFGHAF